MAQTLMQHAFHSGEWAPALNARVDLLKYHSAAALMRNYFVDYRGGASSRPGTKYVLQAFDSVNPVRLISFQITPTVGYVLEFGHQYIRFHFQGQTVIETGIAITGITQANPTVVTVANTWAVNDWVFISGVVGMTQINNRFYRISARTAANITLQRLNGTALDSTTYTAWSSGGTVQRVYKIASPYTGAQLANLKFTQEENKLYIFHPDVAPQVLTFVSATNWTIGAITFAPTILGPTGLAAATTLAAGGVSYSYIVTSVDVNGQESLEEGVILNGYQDFRTTAGTNSLSWNAVANAVGYNVYRAPLAYGAPSFDGIPHGYLGTALGLTFLDSNTIEPDYAQTPPTGGNPLIMNPTTGVIYNQRLYLGGPPSKPNAFFASKPGATYNFTYSQPLQPDDAIIASLSSAQQISIQAMVGMPSGLIMFTDKVVQQLNAGTPGAAATAIEVEAQPQSYVGINNMPPIVANFNILFVQQKSSVVRDITYNFNANIYTGVDISILSSHFFFNKQLLEWSYAEEPFKLIWVVRNDGILLSLTYLKEQELIGWAQHITEGFFKSAATVTELVSGTQIVDATYFVVNRAGTQYIERLDDRFWTTILDCWTMDNALRYSGAASATIRGLDQLANSNVNGLADGIPFGPIAVSADGVLTLPAAASNVLVGHSFRPQLQTLSLELGEPTQQGKRKSISAVTVRVKDTLGLHIGSTVNNGVPMKGLVIGNLNEALNAAVTNLVTTDARTVIDPGWTIPGQYFIDQPNFYPATILGVIPEFTLGDGGKQG